MLTKIKDQSTYEFGILSAECHKFGTQSTQPSYSKNRLGNWPGSSLSWTGATFRATDRSGIRTFADFLQRNPHNWPTNKTFYFYEITKDEQGNRRVSLVHEGVFQVPTQTAALSDGTLMPQATQQSSSNEPTSSMSITRMQEGIINDLRTDLAAVRAERDMLRTLVEQMRADNTQTLNDKIESERANVRWEVEKESTIQMHKNEIEALKAEHERQIERLKEDHERELEAAREQSYQEAEQTLNDEIVDAKTQFMMKGAKVLEDLPTYVDLAKGIATQLGLYKPAPQAPEQMQQLAPAAATQQQARAAQQVQDDPYETADNEDPEYSTMNE